ncbi:MAG: RNA polymerase sigma factor [Treponema bryantii]|nr:RNA polymerase sigma factor [Treponema bryantii]
MSDSQMGFSEVINAGNPVDFRKIYDASMQMLFRIAYKIVNDEVAAEDLVHDSLIKANEKGLEFPSLNDAKYWLIRVVKNASLNYVKRKGREKKAYEKVLYEERHETDSGEIDLLKEESKLKAREALKKLPTNLQEVVILKEYTELNYKEIGRVLGITEGNVKVRIFRAREQLAKIIGEDNVFLPE